MRWTTVAAWAIGLLPVIVLALFLLVEEFRTPWRTWPVEAFAVVMLALAGTGVFASAAGLAWRRPLVALLGAASLLALTVPLGFGILWTIPLGLAPLVLAATRLVVGLDRGSRVAARVLGVGAGAGAVFGLWFTVPVLFREGWGACPVCPLWPVGLVAITALCWWPSATATRQQTS